MKIKPILIVSLSLALVTLSTFATRANPTATSIPTPVSSASSLTPPPPTSATDAYTIIHAAENNVISAEAVCQSDRVAQNLAAQELSMASSQEALSLNKADVAN